MVLIAFKDVLTKYWVFHLLLPLPLSLQNIEIIMCSRDCNMQHSELVQEWKTTQDGDSVLNIEIGI